MIETEGYETDVSDKTDGARVWGWRRDRDRETWKETKRVKKKMLPNLANILASISETDPMNCYF